MGLDILKRFVYNLVIFTTYYASFRNWLDVRIVAFKDFLAIYLEGAWDKSLIWINHVLDASLVDIDGSVGELLEKKSCTAGVVEVHVCKQNVLNVVKMYVVFLKVLNDVRDGQS